MADPVVRVNVGGVWKYAEPFVNISGQWKRLSSVFVNVGGIWKECEKKEFLTTLQLIGDFESDMDGWTITSGSVSVARVSDWSTSGVYSVQCARPRAPMTGTSSFYKDVDLTTGDTLLFDYKGYGDNGGTIFVNVGGTNISLPYGEYRDCMVTVSNYTGIVRITLGVFSSYPAVVAYFDNIRLRTRTLL